MTRVAFIVLYPYNFSDFLYNKMELDYLSESCDVEVWDLSRFKTRFIWPRSKIT
jgi:hypothetical protein